MSPRLLTQDHERLLAWVGRRLVGGVAHLVDAIADVAKACNGREVRQSPCPAQHAEPLLGLGRRWARCLVSDGLAQRDLALRGPRSPLGSVGDKRRALCGVGAASSQLELREHIGRSERPHVGCHCEGRSCRDAARGSMDS